MAEMGASARRVVKERAASEAELVDCTGDRDVFAHGIQPKMAGLPLSAVQEAVGCSPRYASLIRWGLYTPHPMHYDGLGRLASAK